MRVLGIDPGKTGGLAIMREADRGRFLQAECFKMPETERDIADLIRSLGPDFVMIEQVHAIPAFGKPCYTCKRRGGMSTSAMFTFGQGYGFLRGCLIGCNYPFQEVRSYTWQRALNCLTKGDKNISKRKAQQLFPDLKITHATADALLIAYYGVGLAQASLICRRETPKRKLPIRRLART